jgi:hypothetical protein
LCWFVWFVLFLPFCFSTAPQITYISHLPDKWNSSSSIIANLSYPGVDYFLVVIDKSSDTVPSELDGHSKVIEPSNNKVVLGTKDDGEWWVHVRAKAGGKLSDTAHVKVKIDSVGPFYPGSFTAVALDDGSIKLEWSDSKDEMSGVAFYDIYRSNVRFVTEEFGGVIRTRDFTIKDKVVSKVASGVKGNSFIDSNFDKGKGYYYHYKIVATDGAGNLGKVSPAVSVKSASFCEFKVSMDVLLEDFDLKILVGTSQNFSGGKLIVTDPSGSSSIVVENVSGRNSVDANYSLEGKVNGDYNVSFVSFDKRANICSKSVIFSYDTVPPVVNFLSPANNSPLSGVVKLEASGNDGGVNPSGIVSLSFFMKKSSGEVKIGDAVFSNGKFLFDWNTLGYENGRFEVVARAFDKVGNKGEASKSFSIYNADYIKVSVASYIEDANRKRSESVLLLDSLSKKGINVGKLRNILVGADLNFFDAVSMFQSSEFELANNRVSKAVVAYDYVLNAVKIENYGSGLYSYNVNQLDVLLSGSGLDKSLVPEASVLIKKFNPSRVVNLLKVDFDSNSYYLATVDVVFSLDGNFGKVKVVELVPKKFVSDANMIFSSSRFEVLDRDPVLLFYVDSNFGKDVNITYMINKELTKSQADALLDANVWGLWVSPPILVSEKSVVKGFSGNSGVSNLNLPDFKIEKIDNKVWLFGGLFLFIVFILFIFIIVLGVVVYYLFFKKKNGGLHSFR